MLGYARRAIIAVVGARLDTKLNLHLFSRLLRLPLDYFERHPAGETMYQVAQVYRGREFLTGQLLATFLDRLTLAVLLPFLFWLNAPLAWVVLLRAGLISIIILAYLKPMREMYSRVVGAETWKARSLGRTRPAPPASPIKPPSRASERQCPGPDRRRRASSRPCGGVLDNRGNIRDKRAFTRLELQPACLRRCHQQPYTRLHRQGRYRPCSLEPSCRAHRV